MFKRSSICISVAFLSCIAMTCVNFSWCEEREGGDKRRVRCIVGVAVDGCLVGIAKSSDRSMAKEGGIVFKSSGCNRGCGSEK